MTERVFWPMKSGIVTCLSCHQQKRVGEQGFCSTCWLEGADLVELYLQELEAFADYKASL
jgi:hypothetical protein